MPNYFSQPYSSLLDFGTNPFFVSGWIKEAANTAVETILERDSTTTAQRITLAVNASGFLTFTVDDNTTTRTATSNVAIDNNTWKAFACVYDSGNLSIFLDGALDDLESGAALLTLNNASAVLNIGLAVDGAEPLTNGSLSLLTISAGAPSAAQIALKYRMERPRFYGGAVDPTLIEIPSDISFDRVTGLLWAIGPSWIIAYDQNGNRVPDTLSANSNSHTRIEAHAGRIITG